MTAALTVANKAVSLVAQMVVWWASRSAAAKVATRGLKMVARRVVKMAAATIGVTASLMVVTKVVSWAYSKVVSRETYLAFPKVAE